MIEKLTFGLFSKEDSHNFMRLMEYVRPYKSRIIFALIAIVGVAATESYLAAFIAPLVNFGFASPRPAPSYEGVQGVLNTALHLKERVNYMIWGTENKVWAVPIFFITLVLIRGVCRYISSYLLSREATVELSHLR